jgi:hypothetical protein
VQLATSRQLSEIRSPTMMTGSRLSECPSYSRIPAANPRMPPPRTVISYYNGDANEGSTIRTSPFIPMRFNLRDHTTNSLGIASPSHEYGLRRDRHLYRARPSQ